MRKFVGLFFGLIILNPSSGQDKSVVQQPTFGIHYFLNDVATASNIRNSSLSSTLANKRFGNIKMMTPGLAINYSRGISSKTDFTTTLGASLSGISLKDRNIPGNDKLLLEVDASVRSKMFTNNYWFNPFIQLGAGVSKHAGYYGAYIPAGVGIQISFFNEAYFLINSQYRIPVTQTSTYRFFHSVGLAANLEALK